MYVPITNTDTRHEEIVIDNLKTEIIVLVIVIDSQVIV